MDWPWRSLLRRFAVVSPFCFGYPAQPDIASWCIRIIGASLSEPHTDVLAWDSVTRDIYRYRGTDRYLWAGAFSPALYFFSGQTLSIASRHTEPRITRIPMHNTRLRSRAYCAHTDARPAYLRPAKSTWRPVGSGFFSVSDSMDFNFRKILNSHERERCRKVHIDACIHSDAQCSSKAGLSSAKYMTSSQIGFLDALNMPGFCHDGLPLSTSVQTCFVKDPCTCTCTWDTDHVPSLASGSVAPILKMRISGVAGGGVCVVSEEGRGSGAVPPRKFFIFHPETMGFC